jgi:short-subunit dehydrogenase involved in D-alanine esterification of teichoic acids
MTTNIGTGTVLITGPASGLGRALTLELAASRRSTISPGIRLRTLPSRSSSGPPVRSDAVQVLPRMRSIFEK